MATVQRNKLNTLYTQTAAGTPLTSEDLASLGISANLAGPTLQAIFQEFSDCDGAWIGAGNNFANDGFFTGTAFDIAVAEAFGAREGPQP